MDSLAVAASVLYQLGTNGAFLLLSALGLIVILGMMNIINLAHGELMMLGAYTATIAVQRGRAVPAGGDRSPSSWWRCSAPCSSGLIVRRFYGRELGALVVTWGISLILSQGTLLLLGPFMPSIQIPGGSVARRPVFVLGLLADADRAVARCWSSWRSWWLYNRTTFGLQARATMQNAAMARALGVDTDRIYMLTFSLGAGLAGFSGALLAPTTRSRRSWASSSSRQPSSPWWSAAPPTSSPARSARSLLLSLVRTPVGFLFGAFLGLVALLLAALIIIRLMPDGISAWLQRRLDRRARMRLTDALSGACSTGPEDIGRGALVLARLRRR